jgi:alpha-L-rhamnosidase
MYNAIGGIDAAAPGYRKILVRPVPGGQMTHASVGYDSIVGLIESDWKIEGGRFKLAVKIPANTTATVILPTADAASILEGGEPIAGLKTATVQGPRDGGLAVEIGSGSYAFDVAYAPPASAKP